MEKKEKLTKEIDKILFLAGVNNIISESKHNDVMVADNDDIEVVDKEKKQSVESDSEKLSHSFDDYLKTKEEDYLNFPMKYAMVSGNADQYIEDVSYLFMALKKQNKTFEYIINTISPDKVNHIPDLRKLNLSTSEFIKLLENNFKKSPQGELDKIFKLNVGDELKQYQDTELKQKVLAQHGVENDAIYEKKIEEIKRDFATVRGDEKAIISYKFSSPLNNFKLSPLGFWQIQFLSRIISGKPKDKIEAVIFDNKSYYTFYNKAYSILRNFYWAVIFPSAAILTGRQFNINPNDHEFLIMLEVALDKVLDKVKTSYDVKAQNFGAWALTVARNAIIDQIKKMTDYNFQSNHSTLEALNMSNVSSIYFTKDMSDRIPQEDLKKQEVVKEGELYLYEFNSPIDLFNFLRDNEKNQTVLKSIAKQSKRFLNGIGALHSTKKFADVWPEDKGEESYDIYAKKAEGSERDRMFSELFDFYKGISKFSFSKDGLEETEEYKSIKGTEDDGSMYEIYSDEELQEAFERDMGKAIYYYQAEFAKSFPFLSQKIPQEAIDNFTKKYIDVLPETTDVEISKKNEAKKELESLKTKNRGDLVTYAMFFKDKNINKGVVDVLEPYVNYKYKEARDLEKGVPGAIKSEFTKSQQDLKTKMEKDAEAKNMYPKPIYTFKGKDSEVWQQIGVAVSAFNIHGVEKEKKKKQMTYSQSRVDQLKEDFVNYISDFYFNIKLYERTAKEKTNKQVFKLKNIEKIPFSVRKALIETQQGKMNSEMITKFLTIKNPGEDVINYLNYPGGKDEKGKELKPTIKVDYILNKSKYLKDEIAKAYDVDRKVQELLSKRRPQELRRLSRIFSGISGINIQFENKEVQLDKIDAYLLEIKQNFITKTLI